METDFATIYHYAWAALAVVLGSFAFFYTNKMNARNAKAFEKMHTNTGIGLFKYMGQQTLGGMQYFVTKFVGLFFLVLGILILLGIVD